MNHLWRCGMVIGLLCMGLTPPAAAQPPTVRGLVVDAALGRPIAGVEVTVGALRAETDTNGRFALAVPPGDVTVTVQAKGFLPEARVVTVSADGPPIELEVLLFSQTQFAETVNVGADARPAELPPARTEVTPLEVRRVAGAIENVFRVLQTLPGVSAADEIGSRLTVRGGGPDENLTMMDGVEVHNPYRLFGLFSAFNPETVQSFNLAAGGFGAKYGDRLSSLLTVENRPGTETRRFGGSAALAVTDANIVTEGALPGGIKGSWLLTGRRTYYDLIVGRIIDQSLPSFADAQTIVSWLPRPGQRIAITGIRSREFTDANFDEEGTDERFALRTGARNDLVSGSFFTRVGGRGSSRTVVSWYRNTETLDVVGRFRNDARRSNSPSITQFANVAFTRELRLRDVALREDLSLIAHNDHVVDTGVDVHALGTGWAWRITGDRNPSAANGSSIEGGAGLPSLLDSSLPATRVGAWLTDRWTMTSRLTAELGLRLDWNDISRETLASPRLSAAFDLGSGTRLRAAGGLYTQSPGYEKLLQSDYFVDLTAAGTRLRSQRAWHAIAGVERDLGTAAILRTELYWKRFDRVIVGRLETEAERQTRVARYAFPADLATSVPTERSITSVPSNDAQGHSYGFDVYVNKRAVSAADRLTGWASYTWGRAEREAYGRRYPFDYDRRHAVSAVASYRLSRLIELAVTARVASGFPRTPVAALRVAPIEQEIDGTTRLVPARDADGLLIYTTDLGGIDNLNTARLPLFARVDVRTTFTPGTARRWQLYLEVINVANRRNAGSLEPSLEYDPSSDRPRLTYSRDQGVPLIPTFGLRFKF